MAEYIVLSPDGISIDREETYPTPEIALEKTKEWAKQFERQGYYSSNNGRIPLNELIEHCTLVPITE